MSRCYACIALSALFLSGEFRVAESFLAASDFQRSSVAQHIAFLDLGSAPQFARVSRLYVSMYDPRQVSKQSFYTVLGVPPSATLGEIKQSYRRLVKKYHPDSNPDYDTTNMFYALNRAYEVLTDPSLKKKYDMFGPNGVGTSAASDEDSKREDPRRQRPGRPRHSSQHQRVDATRSGGMPADGFEQGGVHSNPAEVTSSKRRNWAGGFGKSVDPDLSHFRQVMDGFSGGFSGARAGEDLHMNFEIDFERAVFGGREAVAIERQEICEHCHGNGKKDGKSANYCGACGGAGFVVETVNTVHGPIQAPTSCHTCQGSGREVQQGCSFCGGSGSRTRSRTVEFTVPAGIEGYSRLRIRGEGHAGPRGGPPGDLFIFLQVKRHHLFSRDGSTIHSNHTVDYIDAILGNTLDTRVVGGNTVTMEVEKGTQHDERIRLEGFGAKSLVGAAGLRGDHCVSVKIGIPTNVSEAEAGILRRLKEIQESKQAGSYCEKIEPTTSKGSSDEIEAFKVTYLADENVSERVGSRIRTGADVDLLQTNVSIGTDPDIDSVSSLDEIEARLEQLDEELRFSTVFATNEKETSGVLNESIEVNGSADASSSPWGNSHTRATMDGEDELSPEEVTQAWIEENMDAPRTRRVWDEKPSNSTSSRTRHGKGRFEEDLFSIFKY